MSTTLLPSSTTAAAAPTSLLFSKFSANASLTRLNFGSQVPSIFTAMNYLLVSLARNFNRLRDRAAATRPAPRRAAEAMRSGRDTRARKCADVVDVPDCRGCRAGERNLQHLVEIAVVEPPVPADAHEIAAHQRIDGRGVEVIYQQTHVRRMAASAVQLVGETRDRHVGDCQQAIEHDPEITRQLYAILPFKLGLRRRQRRANRVVHQIEPQLAAPESGGVQFPHRCDTLVNKPRPG